MSILPWQNCIQNLINKNLNAIWVDDKLTQLMATNCLGLQLHNTVFPMDLWPCRTHLLQSWLTSCLRSLAVPKLCALTVLGFWPQLKGLPYLSSSRRNCIHTIAAEALTLGNSEPSRQLPVLTVSSWWKDVEGMVQWAAEPRQVTPS